MSAVTKEDLLDLVRAIKFAKPDASMRQVHAEITEQLSRNESFEFLSQIPLTDVKKVWKKAVQESSEKRQENASSALPDTSNTEIWKLFTVGNGSVRSLATEYSHAAAKAAVEQQQQKEEKQRAILMDHYVHVFLNVPADRSGQRPHQALINFSDNKVTHFSATKTSSGKPPSAVAASIAGTIICKIQVAASATKFPMLLYNQDRTLKTFIHPPDSQTAAADEGGDDDDDDDDGYDRIYNMIMAHGVSGALGASGGAKAYFYAKLTPRKSGGLGEDVLSIDTRQLATAQNW